MIEHETEHDVLARGAAAETLLGSPFYAALQTHLQNEAFRHFVEAQFGSLGDADRAVSRDLMVTSETLENLLRKFVDDGKDARLRLGRKGERDASIV